MDAFPDPTMQSTLPELDNLPHLTAIIQEYNTSISIARDWNLHQENLPLRSELWPVA